HNKRVVFVVRVQTEVNPGPLFCLGACSDHQTVDIGFGSCGIANLAILQLGKLSGGGESDYPWGGLGCRVKAMRLTREMVVGEKGGKKSYKKSFGDLAKQVPKGYNNHCTTRPYGVKVYGLGSFTPWSISLPNWQFGPSLLFLL
ncbi:hypothetical protein Tco_0075941, partial [Tanacetum coccineum]